MALINGVDGAPLSKRNGSRNIQDLRAAGFLPLAVMNYMARLGHYYESNDLMTWEGLATHFRLARLGSGAARFDESQLLFWQRTAVHALSTTEFKTWLGNEMLETVPVEKQDLFLETIRDNINFPLEAHHYLHIFFDSHFKPQSHLEVLMAAGQAFFEKALNALEMHGTNFTAIATYLSEELGVKGKTLFQPMRVALSGELHGPKLGEMLELIGLEKVRIRLQTAYHLF